MVSMGLSLTFRQRSLSLRRDKKEVANVVSFFLLIIKHLQSLKMLYKGGVYWVLGSNPPLTEHV